MVFVTYPESPNNLPVIPLWINGAAQPISSPASLFPVISSVQDKALHHAVSATPDDAKAAVDSAATAFRTWRLTAPSYRRDLLLKAADVLKRRAQELIAAQVAETSCPLEFAGLNARSAVLYVKEIAAATTELRGTVPQRMAGPDGKEVGGLTVVVREPVGVVMIIPPYASHCHISIHQKGC